MNLLMNLFRPVASLVFVVISAYQKKYHRLPEWYFFAFERVALISAFELLVIKQTNCGDEIFLIKRPDNDPAWPGQWHFPGTILRFYDDKEMIFNRLANELDINKLPSPPKLVDTIIETN